MVFAVAIACQLNADNIFALAITPGLALQYLGSLYLYVSLF